MEYHVTEAAWMITRLLVSNYRSLGADVDIRMGPLTVFVGPNGSGKSNVVDVLRFVSDIMRLGLDGALTKRHGIGAVRRWSSGRPFNLSISLSLEGSGFRAASYAFELTGDRLEEYRVKTEEAQVVAENGTATTFRVDREGADAQWRGSADLRPNLTHTSLALPVLGGDERLKPLSDALKSVGIYSIFPDTLREPQRYDPIRPMEEHGANWVSILKDQAEDAWKPELVAALERLTGDIVDVEVKPVGGYLILRLRHGGENGQRRPKWFDASQESDGTLRVAGIVTALLQGPPLHVIGIEEPELTVHPGAIRLVYDFVREAVGRSQIVATTHSPDLLDLLDPDEVRVVERRVGATTVAPMDAAQKDSVRQRLVSLGDVMRSEGLKQQGTLPFEDSQPA